MHAKFKPNLIDKEQIKHKHDRLFLQTEFKGTTMQYTYACISPADDEINKSCIRRGVLEREWQPGERKRSQYPNQPPNLAKCCLLPN